jgi:hypothetical protein
VGRHPGGNDERAHVERQRDAPLVALDGAQLDRRRRQLERTGQALGDGRQRVVQARSAQQQPRHLGGQVGLLATLLRFARPRPGALGQRARDHRRDEEHDERDPVLALGDREAPGRRDVEEVERERARDRGRDAQPAAPQRRDEQDGEEVDDAERDDRCDLRQRIDERGSDRDGDAGDEGAEPRRAR